MTNFIPSFIDLPLATDVEGPSEDEEYVFVLGARYTSIGGYDKQFSGMISGVILLSKSAPAGFAECVVDCLESMSVNTTGTAVISLGFDVSTRTLTLIGLAPDSDYEKVLQSLVYLNRATDPNIQGLRLVIDDGIGTQTLSLPVNVLGGSRRRRRDTMPTRRRLLSEDEYENVDNESESEEPKNSFVYIWAFGGVGIVISILIILVHIWKRRASSGAHMD